MNVVNLLHIHFFQFIAHCMLRSVCTLGRRLLILHTASALEICVLVSGMKPPPPPLVRYYNTSLILLLLLPSLNRHSHHHHRWCTHWQTFGFTLSGFSKRINAIYFINQPSTIKVLAHYSTSFSFPYILLQEFLK